MSYATCVCCGSMDWASQVRLGQLENRGEEFLCYMCRARGRLCQHNFDGVAHSSRPHRSDLAGHPSSCQWCLAKLVPTV